MTLNLAALERKIAEMADIEAIPQMSAEERATTLAAYRACVEQLALEEREALIKAEQAQGTRTSYAAIKALSRVARKHRTARNSLERLDAAIAQASQGPQTGQATGQVDSVQAQSDTNPTPKKTRVRKSAVTSQKRGRTI